MVRRMVLKLGSGSVDCGTIRVQSSYSGTENNAIEMIFVDEEGNRIRATIMKRYISRFENNLVEGGVYYISNFGVAVNTTRFKMVPHDHKISFYRGTKVVESLGEFKGPLYGFKFVEYTDILNFNIDADLALDIIGILHLCGKVQNKIVQGHEGKLISFELESSDGKRLECSLWDHLAKQLLDHVSNHDGKMPIVVIINIGQVKEFMSRAQITNYFYGTRVMLDVDLSDVETLRTSYVARNSDRKGSFAVVDLDQKGLKSMVEEFVVKKPKKNTTEIRDVKTLGKYIIMGTILAIHLENAWSYLACPKCCIAIEDDAECPDAASNNSKGKSIELWNCEKCDVRGVDAIRRFRVEIQVQDSSGSVSLTVFDRDISKIVKKSATEIYARMPTGEEDSTIPAELVHSKPSYQISL